jgi:hypothetical protein
MQKTDTINNNPSCEDKKVASETRAELEGFDLNAFVVTGETENLSLKKIIIQVPVRKPNKQKFFRVKTEAEFSTIVYVLEIKEDGDYFLVSPNIVPYIIQEVKKVRLNLAYYLDGNPFLIPVPLPDDNGKINSWHSSLDLVVKMAKENWVRAIPDKSINGYTLMQASGDMICSNELPSDKKLIDYIAIAFRGKIIDTLDHPVIKTLLGQTTNNFGV